MAPLSSPLTGVLSRPLFSDEYGLHSNLACNADVFSRYASARILVNHSHHVGFATWLKHSSKITCLYRRLTLILSKDLQHICLSYSFLYTPCSMLACYTRNKSRQQIQTTTSVLILIPWQVTVILINVPASKALISSLFFLRTPSSHSTILNHNRSHSLLVKHNFFNLASQWLKIDLYTGYGDTVDEIQKCNGQELWSGKGIIRLDAPTVTNIKFLLIT